MAQSTANVASSSKYLHDQSPDISLSRKAHDSGGGRVVDGHYVSGHLPPISKKYRVNSALRPDADHATNLYNIESGNDLSSSNRLTHPSKIVPTTESSSLSGSSYKHDPADALKHHDTLSSSSRNVRVYDRPDVSKFNQDTQPNLEGNDSEKTSSNSSNRRERNHSSEKTSSGQWKRLHRIVEQMDDEPCCIILFKWLLIIVGIGMLCVVIEIMGEVLYAWFSGDLEKELLASRIAFKHFSSSKNVSTISNATSLNNLTTEGLNETLIQSTTTDQVTTKILNNE